MKKFVPYNKRSKKAQREADNARRKSWLDGCVVTKVVTSKKQYNRKKNKWDFDDGDFQSLIFFVFCDKYKKKNIARYYNI